MASGTFFYYDLTFKIRAAHTPEKTTEVAAAELGVDASTQDKYTAIRIRSNKNDSTLNLLV